MTSQRTRVSDMLLVCSSFGLQLPRLTVPKAGRLSGALDLCEDAAPYAKHRSPELKKIRHVL